MEPERNDAHVPASARVVCTGCGLEVGETDEYCRHCGRRLKPGVKWYYEPVWVWVLGLLILGPLAIPLAWWSPKMKAGNKLLFTVTVTAITALLVYLCYVIFAYVWNSFDAIREGPPLWGP